MCFFNPPLLEFLIDTSQLPRIQPVRHLKIIALNYIFLLRRFSLLNHYKYCSNKYTFKYAHRSEDQPLRVGFSSVKVY